MAQRTDEMASIVIGDESRVNFFMTRFRKFGFIDYATPSEGGIQVHSSLFNVVLHDSQAASSKLRDSGDAMIQGGRCGHRIR